jgi:hypothetical protein
MNYCQSCFRYVPTRNVILYQNIGAIFVRFSKNVEGNLCKDCISNIFWKFTPTTLILGWWGIISFFVTIFYLLKNIGVYLASLGMEDTKQYAGNVKDRLSELIKTVTSQLEQGTPIPFAIKGLVEAGTTEDNAVKTVMLASKGMFRKCPNCDVAYIYSLDFCPFCGSKLSAIQNS